MRAEAVDQQTRKLRLTDERWEELRREYEAGREQEENALRRLKQLERRHQRIRGASGWRRVLRTLFLP